MRRSYKFLRVLAYKAESAGRELIAVNPANTSRTCARCGHCAAENRVNPISQRRHIRPKLVPER